MKTMNSYIRNYKFVNTKYKEEYERKIFMSRKKCG